MNNSQAIKKILIIFPGRLRKTITFDHEFEKFKTSRPKLFARYNIIFCYPYHSHSWGKYCRKPYWPCQVFLDQERTDSALVDRLKQIKF